MNLWFGCSNKKVAASLIPPFPPVHLYLFGSRMIKSASSGCELDDSLSELMSTEI